MDEPTLPRTMLRVSFPFVQQSVGLVALLGMMLLLVVCSHQLSKALVDDWGNNRRHRHPKAYKGAISPLAKRTATASFTHHSLAQLSSHQQKSSFCIFLTPDLSPQCIFSNKLPPLRPLRRSSLQLLIQSSPSEPAMGQPPDSPSPRAHPSFQARR